MGTAEPRRLVPTTLLLCLARLLLSTFCASESLVSCLAIDTQDQSMPLFCVADGIISSIHGGRRKAGMLLSPLVIFIRCLCPKMSRR
jgi:hypothetical protein